jgi:ribosomal protein S18 acetylase RimI-like enzyme
VGAAARSAKRGGDGLQPSAMTQHTAPTPAIRTYRERDFAAVEAIWTALFPATAPYHAPAWSIHSMVAHAPDLFFVAELDGEVVGTVLAGWDGHRGWIYSLGVRPDQQRNGIGSALLTHAVAALRGRGCPKANLQIRGDNRAVVGFYERHGWKVEDRVSMGLSIR